MGPKPDLTQAVCLRRCSYYKPGKNEELACRGYVVLERLAQQGNLIDDTNTEHLRCRDVEEPLVQALCMVCPFHEQDCDFMENRALPPCGGFVLLMQLLGKKKISIDEVK
jgi:hypothetical protein